MEECGGYWLHSGDPKKPHVELTKGECSNGFFNCLKALKFINLNILFAYQLARKIREEIGDQRVDWVIGSPMAGIALAYEVARQLGAPIYFFTDKDPNGALTMSWQREVIPPDHYVLRIEELITTSGTTEDVKEAVEHYNPYPVKWIPVIGVFVHRPAKLPVTHYGDSKVIALFEREVWKEEPPCRLCNEGSVPLKPKANWHILTGK